MRLADSEAVAQGCVPLLTDQSANRHHSLFWPVDGCHTHLCVLCCRVALLSDNEPHKVTIATLAMPAVFRHYCVPQLAQQAYIQALCTNTSGLLLLGSQQVNVFLGQ